MRQASILAIALLLLCCGITYVKGPDGNNDWFEVQCRREANCMKKAAKQCPTGFLLAESQSGTSTFYAKAPEGDEDDTIGNSRTMYARCGQEKEETRSEEEEEGFKPIAKPKDLSGCGRAYDNFDELSKSWLEWHPTAEAAEKKPNRAEFIAVCGDLPDNAQFCLTPKYTNTHKSECAETLDDLAPKIRVRIAGLFEKDAQHPAAFALPPPPVVDSGIGDGGDAGDGGKPGKDAGAPKTKPGAPIKDAGVKDATLSDATLATKDATAD